MISPLRKYAFLLILHLAWLGAYAQGHVFSKVSINPGDVYVGQPAEVTVSVFTSTWFTKGVDPGNIKVNGAFTIYFRSVSSSERINGLTYAGVNMIFNVFPYEDEDIIFPSLELNVETPDEGDSKGVRRVVKTEAKGIKVKPVPNAYDQEDWMVSPSVSVRESWSGDLNKVKVGSVLERNITREVQGSVAELIPPIHWDSIEGVSIYPRRADVKNNRSRTDISASRSDGVSYLFEKEGEVEIPELVVLWWNPQSSRMQKRTLKKVLIQVGPNPDPGMLSSIRDSLSLSSAPIEGDETEEKSLSFLGLSIWQFIALLLIGIIGIYLIIRIYRNVKKVIIIQRTSYRNSEAFYFNKYRAAARRKDASLARQNLYRWIDQLQLEEPTLSFFAKNYGNDDLGDSSSNILNISTWARARNNYLKGKTARQKNHKLWINP